MKILLFLLGLIISLGTAHQTRAALVNKVSTNTQSESTSGKTAQTSYVALSSSQSPYSYYTILNRGGTRPQNYVIPQIFTDRANRMQLSIHEAGSGLGFSHDRNRIETMGRRTFLTQMRMINVKYPTTFFFNYVNEANYQALICQNWQCTYQHRKNGRFVEELEQSIELTNYKNTPLEENEYMTLEFTQYMVRAQITLTRNAVRVENGVTTYSGMMTNRMDVNLNSEQMLEMWGSYWVEDYLPVGAGNEEVAGNQYISTSTMARHATSDHLINRYYRQTDPDWASAPLGHSRTLTIGSDGCAMVSALMLLEYYGHHTNFERGNSYNYQEGTYDRQLNPALFNEWLKSRPYGFLEGVYLNWAEISRFSLESHRHYYSAMGPNLPKLEFLAVGGAGVGEGRMREAINEDLTSRSPVILNIGGSFGHFNVAVNNHSEEPYDLFSEGDWVVADPYYSGWRSWQQIKEKGRHNLLGVRRFVPSFTDLSYLIFYSFSDQLQIRLINDEGEATLLEPWADEITSPLSEEEMPLLYQYTLAKPETGYWTISIVNPAEEGARVSALIYSTEAEVLAAEENILVEAEGVVMLNLDLQKEESPSEGR